MKLRLILALIISLLVASHAYATGSLNFGADGYIVGVGISYDTGKIISPIAYSAPGDEVSILIPKSAFKVLRFNLEKQQFHAKFINRSDPKLPKSFTIIVHGAKGLLVVASKKIRFTADWSL
jgi:hypothetical protein